MPIKKKTPKKKVVKKTRTKTRATKTKTTTRKKRASSVSKKTVKAKPAKKKTTKVAKKTTVKSKKKKVLAKPKKKVVKKSVPAVAVERAISPSTKAGQLHNRQIQTKQHVYLAPTKTNTAFSVSGFSFQKALSQVRDKVHTTDEPIAITPIEAPIKLELDDQPEQPHFSPYVLDLKSRKTVVTTHKLSLNSAKPEQVQLGLFEEEVKTPVQFIAQSWNNFLASLKPRRRINLIPREQKQGVSLSQKIARKHKRFQFHLEEFGELLSRPYQLWRDAKRQKTFGLPRETSRQKQVPLISNRTRSGEAIPVSRIDKIHQKAKNVAASAQISVTSLSDVLKRQPKPKKTFSLEHLSLQKAFMPFAVLAFVILLPFAGASLYEGLSQTQGEVLGATNQAVSKLQSATNYAKSFQFLQASKDFQQASQTFLAASALIENQQGLSTKALSVLPVVGEKVRAGKDLLTIGNELSEAATLFSQGIAVLADEKHFLVDQPMSYKLEYLFVRLQEAQPHVQSAVSMLNEIDPANIPEDIQGDIEMLKQSLPVLSEKLHQFTEMDQSVLSFLGHQNLERYLVVFQNNTELRATGGFFGSLALVDIDRAEIKNIEIPGGGPYDFQGSLYKNYESPRAMQLINPRWELQDTNWFFDWPTSAQKITHVYEQSGGPTVDGVIALNTNVLQTLLEFTGPVQLASYEKEFSAENFREILQQHVEFEYDEELNQPKKIIADLAPVLLERVKLLDPVEYLELAAHLGELFQTRELFIYHTNEDVQKEFSKLGWSGEVVQTESDYLAIVHTNLAGGKTDGVIKDSYDLTTHFSENNTIQHTLTIARTHTGQKGIPLIGVRNVDYLRVYVPKGSKLISATGFEKPPTDLFESPGENWIVDQDLLASQGTYTVDSTTGVEIYEESGKTVFADWVQTDPGERQEIQITYEVPASVISEFILPTRESSWLDWVTGKTVNTEEEVKAYQLYWQKQSGAWDPEMHLSIDYPQEWQLQSFSDVTGDHGIGKWSAQASMNADSLWNFLLY